MEGKISGSRARKLLASVLVLSLAVPLNSAALGQQSSSEHEPGGGTQLQLRRSVERREYRGGIVEGEERTVAAGDTLWRLLVEEQGLSAKRFNQYLVIIRALNPRIKNLGILKIGDTIFVPLHPDELLGAQPVFAKREETGTAIARGTTTDYRVKRGEHLYQILREQLGIQDQRELAINYALVKDLNPERKHWDALQEGEVIRLPTPVHTSEIASSRNQRAGESASAANRPRLEAKPFGEAKKVQEDRPAKPKFSGPDYARQIQARENLLLLRQVIEALGNEIQQTGQEILPVKEGTIRIDRNSYPVIFNPKLDQKIILDPDDKIPPALQARLASSMVVSIKKGASLQEFINHALPRLGYQALPSDRPLIIKDGGIGYELKGSWIVMAPEESHKPQEIFIINLTEAQAAIPEYLKEMLLLKGINLKDIFVPSAPGSQLPGENHRPLTETKPDVKTWPREKEGMIDAILELYGINFSSSHDISVELHEGLRLDARSDRLFEFNGRKVALFFSQVTDEIKRALREKHGTKPVEFDLSSVSPREMISRVLDELGEGAVYYEHRFPAADGANGANLLVTAWGFLLPQKNLFITDREIPQGVLRFFFEKGLQVVYF
jgi:hypothetical protein